MRSGEGTGMSDDLHEVYAIRYGHHDRRSPANFIDGAADATHLYAHIDGGRVFPLTYNIEEVVEGYATLKKLASAPQHVVPGHDPLVLKRYPAAKPGLEGWVVRLDAEPKSI
jgi:hypothetical protein